MQLLYRDMVYNIFLIVRSEPLSCGKSDNPVQNRWDIFHKRQFMECAPLPPVNNVDPTLNAFTLSLHMVHPQLNIVMGGRGEYA